MSTKNTINWFEIPVTDTARAVAYYSHLLATELTAMDYEGTDMVMLPCDEGGVGGALSRHPLCKPSDKGTIVYLAAEHFEGGLDGCLARAGERGGAVVMPRTSIGEHGFIGMFKDTEGNIVGLHAMA